MKKHPSFPKVLDDSIRNDFPLLSSDIAYLDNAATSQKPLCVLEAERRFYETMNANPLRGLYDLSVRATDAYEEARSAVQHFVHAACPEEIIFTRNATESLNLAAFSWCQENLHPGDELLVSVLEHHSNLLPWQQAARRCCAEIRYLFPDREGRITEEAFRKALTPKTRLAAVTQISNVIGRENPIRAFAAAAHENGTLLAADGAQSVPHIPVNVQDLDVDFLAFSGHKMLGPMGIGVLYGKRKILEEMPPFLCGGEMIESVTLDGAVYAELPHKFEAGTVNAAGAVGLQAAVQYMERLGFNAIMKREEALTERVLRQMQEIPWVTVLGSEDPAEHHGILAFRVEGVHPHDIAAMMDADGICIRAGHHCAQPLLAYLKAPSTARVSLAFYNTDEEADRFIASLKTLRSRMGM